MYCPMVIAEILTAAIMCKYSSWIRLVDKTLDRDVVLGKARCCGLGEAKEGLVPPRSHGVMGRDRYFFSTRYALLTSLSCSKIRIGACLPLMESSVMTTSLICF